MQENSATQDEVACAHAYQEKLAEVLIDAYELQEKDIETISRHCKLQNCRGFEDVEKVIRINKSSFQGK